MSLRGFSGEGGGGAVSGSLFPLVIRNIVPMFQYSPRVRGNDCVSLAFPRGFLVLLSLKGGMAYLGELI